MSVTVRVGLPAQPAQWNLFIPFHRGEISFALISSGWLIKKIRVCLTAQPVQLNSEGLFNRDEISVAPFHRGAAYLTGRRSRFPAGSSTSKALLNPHQGKLLSPPSTYCVY
jgi:hypothetical protein